MTDDIVSDSFIIEGETQFHTEWFKTYCCGAQVARNPNPEDLILFAISSGRLTKGDAWKNI